MMKKQVAFVLRARDRTGVEGILRDGNVPQKIVKRAKIVLMTADGAGVMTCVRAVGVSKTTVWRWQDYFVEAGVSGLVKGRTKPPGKRPIADAIKLKIIEKTVKERPGNATHWSVRMMAEEIGISHTSVLKASTIDS
jgi:transposase